MATENTSGSAFMSAMKDLVAGSAGGFMQVVVGHPPDTMKVRLQTQVVVPGQPLKYQGLVDCVKKTLAEEGVGGFYKGVASPLVGMSTFNASLFLSYGQSKKFLLSRPGRIGDESTLTIPETYLAGAITGFCGSFVECPMDLFKIKLQGQIVSGSTTKYRGVFDAGKQIATTYGLRGVYQGFGATILRNVPANSLYFGTYELSRRAFTPEGGSPSPFVNFMAGGIGGVSYWLFTYPFEIVKTRIQSDNSNRGERKYKHALDCFVKTYKNEGLHAFSRGLSACMVRSFPANAACFLAYETVRARLN